MEPTTIHDSKKWKELLKIIRLEKKKHIYKLERDIIILKDQNKYNLKNMESKD